MKTTFTLGKRMNFIAPTPKNMMEIAYISFITNDAHLKVYFLCTLIVKKCFVVQVHYRQKLCAFYSTWEWPASLATLSSNTRERSFSLPSKLSGNISKPSTLRCVCLQVLSSWCLFFVKLSRFLFV